MQIFCCLFGNLAVFRLEIWLIFVWKFGCVSFGNLAVFRLEIWLKNLQDLQFYADIGKQSDVKIFLKKATFSANGFEIEFDLNSENSVNI